MGRSSARGEGVFHWGGFRANAADVIHQEAVVPDGSPSLQHRIEDVAIRDAERCIGGEGFNRLRKATLYADIIEAGRIPVELVDGFAEGQWSALAIVGTRYFATHELIVSKRAPRSELSTR